MLKRLFDLCVSFFLLLIFSPVLLLLATLIRWKLGPHIFFRQTRPGLQGLPFEIIKFRTMLDIKNKEGVFLPDEQRISAFGNFLRSLSLDELPELWNVLKGDMSLVGPRPLLMEYLPLYNEEQMQRHHVKPGITGWAQVNGRNAISWQEKFQLDLWYVKHHNFWLDLKILWMTASKVIQRRGICSEGHVSAEKFNGNGCETK